MCRVASLIMPSIITSLGIALNSGCSITASSIWPARPASRHSSTTTHGDGPVHLGLGAHLTWTLPFGLLVMFAIFNRFDPAGYEEAARDLGATPWQTFSHVVLPIIGPSVIGVGMFGFTLSWDEIARTSQAIGEQNTLPLELQGLTTTVTTPVIYALGTMTTIR
jgi:putative spermidine/putrescine transport system permease protein